MKRIIACCDGTWNRPETTEDGKPVRTNVEILYNCILSNAGSVKQLKFYESGVGSSTWDVVDRFFGGIKGLGIDQRIMDIYTFIVMNYEEGDEIFLFGFSRGAYTARSIAGLIRNCGILKKENIQMVEKAYRYYRDRNAYTSPDSDFMQGFRKDYSVEHNTIIKFIGVWDTVGALGLPLRFARLYNIEKYKFHDVKLSSFIENAFHALAIDEHRKLFSPTLWTLTKTGIAKNQIMEQRWFAGSHSNVGGGYLDTGLSDLALKWLVSKATDLGLAVRNPQKGEDIPGWKDEPDYKGVIVNSRKFYYRLWFRNYRLISIQNRIDNPNIVTNEKIDESVLERFLDPTIHYRPKNAVKILQTLGKKSLEHGSR